MTEGRFATAAVIGTGMMGPGIGLLLALGGLRTTLVSRTEAGAARGLESARALAEVLRANELAETDALEAAVARMDASAAFDETIRGADIVVESGPENLEYKREIFARMDALAAKTAVLASNTSGLSITAIAERCKHPERVLTTHFWNPPHLVPLVEIVKGEKTSDEAAEAVRELLLACGKTPVVVKKDRPGQLGNRLQMALVREAAYMIAEGIATAEDIDTAIKTGLGLRYPAYGLLEHQDVVGLDLTLAVCAYVGRDLYREREAPPHLAELVARGETGARAGKGFHDWSTRTAEEVKARRDAFLIEFLRGERRKAKQAARS